jgi:hypothetical protein
MNKASRGGLPVLLNRPNLQRGLFRAWITLSATWSLFFFYYALDQAPKWDRARGYLFWLPFFGWASLRILIPWLPTAAVMLIRWIIRGFGSN